MRNVFRWDSPDGFDGRGDDVGEPGGPTVLARGDALLDRVTTNFCLAIRPLFDTGDRAFAPLLVATMVDARGRRDKAALRCWDAALCQTDLPLDPTRRRDHDIIRTATILIELLSVRWPASAQPTRIGVLSDGTGVAIAPEDPCPTEPGWINRRLADPRGLIALKRFAPDGGLALLQAPRLSRAARH